MKFKSLLIVFALFSFSTHAAELSWIAPDTRVDGSTLPISEIGGYKIYSGRTAESLTLLIDIADPNTNAYSDGQPAGTYYAVTAYNVYGAESDYSAIKQFIPKAPSPPVLSVVQ